MSNLSDQKTLNGRSIAIGPAIFEEGTPVLDPKTYEGSWVYSGDHQMFFSNGSEWQSNEIPLIRTPTAIAPTNTDEQIVLKLTPFTLTDSKSTVTQTGIIFQLSLNQNMTNPLFVKFVPTTTGTSYTLAYNENPELKPGVTFYWRGRYTATSGSATNSGAGNQSYFSITASQVFPEYVDTPRAASTMISGARANIIQITDYHSPFKFAKSTITWTIYGEDPVTKTVNYNNKLRNITTTNNSSSLNLLTKDSSNKPLVEANVPYYWQARYTTTTDTGRAYTSEYSPLFYNIQVDDVQTPVALTTSRTTQLLIGDFVSFSNKIWGDTEWEIYSGNTDTYNALIAGTAVTPIVTLKTSGNPQIAGQTYFNLQFADSKIVPETPYYWRVRYKTTDNKYSDYSNISTFVKASIIDPVYVIEDKNNLRITPFVSLYGLTLRDVNWEIYLLPDTTNQTTVIPIITISALGNSNYNILDLKSRYITGVRGLYGGVQYYWRANYTTTTGVKSSYAPDTAQSIARYTQPSNIKTPVITPLAKVDTYYVKGPSITFTSDAFQNLINPTQHYSSSWSLYKRTGPSYVKIAGIERSSSNKLSWTYDGLQDMTTEYYVQVAYFDSTGDSASSSNVYFTTQPEFSDVLTTTPNPNQELLYGENFEGGYYAGVIWNYIATANTNLNKPVIGAQFTVTTDVNMRNTPIVYKGQMVELRLADDPFCRIRCTVVRALQNTLVLIPDKLFNGSNNATYGFDYTGKGPWYIMSRFRLIMSKKTNNGSFSTTDYKLRSTSSTTLNNTDILLRNLSDGYRNTQNMLTDTDRYPAAGFVQVFNNNYSPSQSGINGTGYNDWYIPSRDELDLLFCNLMPTTSWGGLSTGKTDENQYLYTKPMYSSYGNVITAYHPRIVNNSTNFGSLPDDPNYFAESYPGKNRNAYTTYIPINSGTYNYYLKVEKEQIISDTYYTRDYSYPHYDLYLSLEWALTSTTHNKYHMFGNMGWYVSLGDPVNWLNNNTTHYKPTEYKIRSNEDILNSSAEGLTRYPIYNSAGAPSDAYAYLNPDGRYGSSSMLTMDMVNASGGNYISTYAFVHTKTITNINSGGYGADGYVSMANGSIIIRLVRRSIV